MKMKVEVRGESYTAIVHEDRDEGGYWADVPKLHGCVTQGETLDELRLQISDAIESWLDAQDPEWLARTPPLTEADLDAMEETTLSRRNPQ